MLSYGGLDHALSLKDDWLSRELRHVNLGDKRLAKRLIKTSLLIEGKASGSINRSCRSWKDAKGAYRLLSHQKVQSNEIYTSHHQETSKRIQGKRLIFAAQDTTALDFDTHVKTQGLGSISKAYGKHNKGLLVHSTLLITQEGLPLGLSSQKCWARWLREETPQEKTKRRYTTRIQEKESYKWILALKETIALVPTQTHLITLGDREADIFEFLWSAATNKTFFVIRNRQPTRKFICPQMGKTYIRTRLEKLSDTREMVIQIPSNESRKARSAQVEIKYMTGFIPIRSASLYGSRERQHKISDKVAVSVVSVKEINLPQGQAEGIEWILLTNVFVNSFEEAIERVRWYQLRWVIEEYFRILKSGCKIENSRLSTKERLQNLLAIKSIIAFKILYLTKVVRSHPEETCTHVLSCEEWKTLYIREHLSTRLPQAPPNIKQAVLWLGKLGGFMNRKSDKFPGTMTLWRGYEILKESVEMLKIITPQSCG